MQKLRSFGCSFIYGNDLKDCPHGTGDDNPPPSSLTWPALIAKDLDLEYHCHARPAASNLQIMHSVLCELQDDPDAIYVINWTWIDRFGYFDEEKKSGLHPWNPLGWSSVMPMHDDAKADFYYRNLHSQTGDKLTSLIYMQNALHALQRQGARVVMTYTDDLLWETQWHTTAVIKSLQEKLAPFVSGFEGKGFVDWARSQDHDFSEKGHPLESAHRAAADLFSDAIRRII